MNPPSFALQHMMPLLQRLGLQQKFPLGTWIRKLWLFSEEMKREQLTLKSCDSSRTDHESSWTSNNSRWAHGTFEDCLFVSHLATQKISTKKISFWLNQGTSKVNMIRIFIKRHLAFLSIIKHEETQFW